MDANFLRPGTTSLARGTSLGRHILGLCEIASTEIRLAPQAHQDRPQQLYTLAHEGLHRDIFIGTTFGYVQLLLARMGQVAVLRELPSQFAGHQETLDDMMAVSLEAHEGFATLGEYVVRDALASLGGRPPMVSRPTPQYEQAMEPYRKVWEALPREVRPFSHFVLRAFAELVFDTNAIVVAQDSGLNVAALRESLAEPTAQPNYRLERLSAKFAEILENPLGPEWSYFAQFAAHAPIEELTQAIAQLRLLSPSADAVQQRKGILKRAREAVRTALCSAGEGLVDANGIKTVVHFHNWCYEEFRSLQLLKGPMLSYDAAPARSAEHMVKNQGVSGHPAPRLQAVALEADLQSCVNFMLMDPPKRLAVGLRIHEHVAGSPDPMCQLRIVRFEPKTDSWDGPGTPPYQRILTESSCTDQYMTVEDATLLFEKLRDRIDIIHPNTKPMSDSVAAIADAVIGTSKATFVHLIDTLAEVDTDQAKIEFLTRSYPRNLRGYVPYEDDDWVALFYETVPRTFVGAVVLKLTLATTLRQDYEPLISRLRDVQLQALAEDEDYRISLGSLSTFAKIYIYGGFLDI